MRLTFSAAKNAACQCVISHTKYSDSEGTALLKKNTHLLLTCILHEQYFIWQLTPKSSLGPFHITASSTAVTNIPICHESQSTRYISIYCS